MQLRAAKMGYPDVVAYALDHLRVNPRLKDNAGIPPILILGGVLRWPQAAEAAEDDDEDVEAILEKIAMISNFQFGIHSMSVYKGWPIRDD